MAGSPVSRAAGASGVIGAAACGRNGSGRGGTDVAGDVRTAEQRRELRGAAGRLDRRRRSAAPEPRRPVRRLGLRSAIGRGVARARQRLAIVLDGVGLDRRGLPAPTTSASVPSDGLVTAASVVDLGRRQDSVPSSITGGRVGLGP